MRTFLVLTIALIVRSTFALDNPETIAPKTRIIKPLEWYANQAQLWRTEVLESPSEENWLNYYTAARYAQWPAAALLNIANEVDLRFPGSLAASITKAWNLPYDKNGHHLQSAAAIDQNHVILISLQALNYEGTMKTQERKNALQKLWENNGVSSSLLNYSYNLLMSVEEGAILLTEAENTTLPVWLLQDIFNVRKDVVVLNLDLLLSAEYRDAKLAADKLVFQPSGFLADDQSMKKTLCQQLPAQNPQRKFFYSLTMGQQNISPIKDQLYVVGLASQISTTRVDNIARIRENLENHFLLDYLAVDFNGESEFGAGKVLSANYLLPMLLLAEHYAASGQNARHQHLLSLIEKVAEQTGKKLLVQNFLNRESQPVRPFVSAKLPIKSIDGMQRIVRENIYASEYEVTNQEYQRYIDFLIAQNLTDELAISRIDLSKYEEPALSFMKSYHMKQTPTKKERYFTNYPVVNISHEAATTYCAWLTDQYNNHPDRKFKKVKFRLPLLNEWQVAAAGIPNATSWKLGENSSEVKIYEKDQEYSKNFETKMVSLGDPEILYPWFKNYNFRNTVINNKGCPLGNFKWAEDKKPCVSRMTSFDGWLLMSPVGAYFPNDIGLYDVVGNVAEMTAEKGQACGGSWNHAAEESTIKSINRYEGPDASIGFRVFMEVIEK